MKLPPYTVYGARAEHPISMLLSFNGQNYDPLSGCYPLGLGYRMYSPSLMRFLSPDSLSPFGLGGLNAFAYCQNDPVNHVDPTGHMLKTPTPKRSRSPLEISGHSPPPTRSRSPLEISRRSPPRWSASPDRASRSRSLSASSVTTERMLSGYNGEEIDFELDFLNEVPPSTVPNWPSNQQVTGNLNASPAVSWPAFFQSKGFLSNAQISYESRRLASSIPFNHVIGNPQDYRTKVAIYMYAAGSSVDPSSVLRFTYPDITPFQLSEIALYAEEIRLSANTRF